MDLIVDYITYVFIPAFALFQSGLLPGWAGWFANMLIIYTSIVYFADTGMKTRDYSFSGFAGCCNMVVLVFFALEPNSSVILVLVVLLAISMFLPLKFVHPVRTEPWRKLTLPATLLWVTLAGLSVFTGFNLPSWAEWALGVSSVYLVLAGIV
jgi:phosphatidylcholine synthase